MSSYLIGAGYEDRDFAAFSAWSVLIEDYFPNHRRLWDCWGKFNWPPFPTIPPEMQQKYARFVTRNPGDCILFDVDVVRDATLIATLRERMSV